MEGEGGRSISSIFLFFLSCIPKINKNIFKRKINCYRQHFQVPLPMFEKKKKLLFRKRGVRLILGNEHLTFCTCVLVPCVVKDVDKNKSL